MTFRIAIGSDHAGFAYKEAIKRMLTAEGHTVLDVGTHSEAPCDYPDFCRPVALAVAGGDCDRGIVLSGGGDAAFPKSLMGVIATVRQAWMDADWYRTNTQEPAGKGSADPAGPRPRRGPPLSR